MRRERHPSSWSQLSGLRKNTAYHCITQRRRKLERTNWICKLKSFSGRGGKWAGALEGCSQQHGANWGQLASHSVRECVFCGQIFAEKEPWLRMKLSVPFCSPSQSPLELHTPTPVFIVSSWLCLGWWFRGDCTIVIKFVHLSFP